MMKATPNFRTLDLNLLRVFDQVMADISRAMSADAARDIKAYY